MERYWGTLKNELVYHRRFATGNEAREAIERSDRYVLLTVLFASVLFFAGVSTKFKKPYASIPVILMGYVLFIFAIIVLAFQPIH